MSIVYLAVRPATQHKPEALITVQTSSCKLMTALTQAAFEATMRYYGEATKQQVAMDRWLRKVDVEIYPSSAPHPRASA